VSNILLIGDDCTDVYQYGTVDRISPEAPVPVFKFTTKEIRGGMVRSVRQALENLNLKVHCCRGWTSTKTRLIDTRSGQQLLRIDDDVISPSLQFKHLPGLANYDAVVVSDYNKGYVSYELVEQIIQNYHGPVFIDTKKPDLVRFEGAIVKINSSEYAQRISDCTKLIVTQGEKGALYDGQLYPAPPTTLVDVTGAGDTFLSFLVYGFLLHGKLEQAIPLAVRAASISIQHRGVYAPLLEELHET
jgi:D-beta-D-heptose 7-phosphate kinase/D-beta-D-heptose 1-phosphate adenosyltransferase